MSSLAAWQLLQTVAQQYRKEKETFSKHEIVAKINEIKYLSAQRKVPRITLRKEVIHLENKLQALLDLESSLLKQKKNEAAKIALFKKQISMLQKQLAATEDHDLSKKVEKLSQLLGDYTAQRKTREGVALAAGTVKLPGVQGTKRPDRDMDRDSRFQQLQGRLQQLKEELGRKKRSGGSYPELEQKIILLEKKLLNSALAGVPMTTAGVETAGVEIVVEKREGKHTLLFGEPIQEAAPASAPEEEDLEKEEDLEVEKELPRPPPPRRKR